MPKVTNITYEQASGLREQGYSMQEIADHFKVCKSTVKNLLKTSIRDTGVLNFTRKLEALLSEVPNEYCAKEIRRVIYLIQINQAGSKD